MTMDLTASTNTLTSQATYYLKVIKAFVLCLSLDFDAYLNGRPSGV